MRAKEAEAEDTKRTEEARFLATFQGAPKNTKKLSELANSIVNNFNTIMIESRQAPYQRQEDLMAGLRKLFAEQVNVIDARRAYTIKINPSTAIKEGKI